MRVMLVTQYFRPQPLANAEVVGALAHGLAERGHDVDVVTPVRQARSAGRLRVRRAPGYFARDRSSTPKRAAEYLAFSGGAVLRSLTTPHPDVVLVPSPPPTLGLIGLLIARLRRSTLVYNVQDLYPEVALATGMVRGGPALRALAAAMRLVYRKAGAVVVIDEQFVPGIEGAAPQARVRAVRNSIDLAPFRHAERDEAYLRSLGVPEGAQVVMYAGNIGRSQDLEAVVEATAACGAHLVVHGGGARRQALQQEVEAAGHHHVHFSDFVDRDRLGMVFASADLHVVPLKPDIASASVPSKLLSIWAAGRTAVVAVEAESATARLVEQVGGGWVVPPGDRLALQCAMRHALSADPEREARGTQARAWALANAGRDRAAAEVERVLLDVMGARHG